MDGGKDLPQELQRRLGDKGYMVTDTNKPLDLGNEKYVYNAVRLVDKTQFVALHSKVRKHLNSRVWSWDYRRELKVFQAVQGKNLEGSHKHIIRMEAMVQPDPENTYGPCMVIEKVDPLGYDMFTVHQQCQFAKRVMPVPQLVNYIDQVLDALKYLHGCGWIHCDIKVDNVLIDKDHRVKLIDFGLARQAGKERVPEVRANYMPPECVNGGPMAKPATDAWLLGGVIQHFYTHDYLDPQWVDTASREPKGVSKHLLSRSNRVFKDRRVSGYICEALDGLIRYRPDHRWDLQEAKAWVDRVLCNGDGDSPQGCSSKFVDVALTKESFKIKVPESFNRVAGLTFQKSPKLNRPVKVFGLQATGKSDITKEMIGKQIGNLGLRQAKGQTVLFIDRMDTASRPQNAQCRCLPGCFSNSRRSPQDIEGVVAFPQRDTVIERGDWLYLKMPGPFIVTIVPGDATQSQNSSHITPEGLDFAERVEHEARTAGVEAFLEFDEFLFPEYCAGMTIGGGGESSIELRRIFGIGLAFVRRPTSEENGAFEVLDVLPSTVIQSGDYGLICRVPDRVSGFPRSIVNDAFLRPLLDEKMFKKRMGHRT